MSQDDELIRFQTGGHTFVLTQYKVGLIYKYIDDLKDYWELPLEPNDSYRIRPSDRKREWHVDNILGYQLSHILHDATEINRRLDPKFRVDSSLIRKVEKYINEAPSETTSEFDDVFEPTCELYRWQKEALETWYSEEGKRGVVEAATGTGKTRLALVCMEKFYQDCPDGVVCIVVPSTALFIQWKEKLHTHFPVIPENNYCYNGSGHKDIVNLNTKVIITTQQSLTLQEDTHYGCALLKYLRRSGRNVLIVFDEVHRIGAPKILDRFVRYIPVNFYTLGLSATPDRLDGAMEEVYKYFDTEESEGPIYYYSLSEAVEEGVLSPVVQMNYKVSLTNEENSSHQHYCEQIKTIKAKIINNKEFRVDSYKVNSGNIAYLVDLERKLVDLQKRKPSSHHEIWELIKVIQGLSSAYIQRRRVFNKAAEKWELLNSLLTESVWFERFTHGRWIFFHAEISECEKTYDLLQAAIGEKRVRSYHSDMNKDKRKKVLDDFDAKQFNCLCAVDALNEGLDVPGLAGVVIISGDTTKRQQIQRCGRALRRDTNKPSAYLVSFLAQADNDLNGEKLLICPDNPTKNWAIINYTFS